MGYAIPSKKANIPPKRRSRHSSPASLWWCEERKKKGGGGGVLMAQFPLEKRKKNECDEGAVCANSPWPRGGTKSVFRRRRPEKQRELTTSPPPWTKIKSVRPYGEEDRNMCVVFGSRGLNAEGKNLVRLLRREKDSRPEARCLCRTPLRPPLSSSPPGRLCGRSTSSKTPSLLRRRSASSLAQPRSASHDREPRRGRIGLRKEVDGFRVGVILGDGGPAGRRCWSCGRVVAVFVILVHATVAVSALLLVPIFAHVLNPILAIFHIAIFLLIALVCSQWRRKNLKRLELVRLPTASRRRRRFAIDGKGPHGQGQVDGVGEGVVHCSGRTRGAWGGIEAGTEGGRQRWWHR